MGGAIALVGGGNSADAWSLWLIMHGIRAGATGAEQRTVFFAAGRTSLMPLLAKYAFLAAFTSSLHCRYPAVGPPLATAPAAPRVPG